MSQPAPQKATPDNTIETFLFEGFPLQYKHYNKGRTTIPLIFIGGAFQNITNVEKLNTAISEETWVIAIDTPGNGATGVLPRSFSFDFIAEAIVTCLTSINITRFNLFGGSYSSITALTIARLYPNLVNQLILGSAMATLPRDLEYSFNLLLHLLEWNRTEEFADTFTDLMTNPDLRSTNPRSRHAAKLLHAALINASDAIKAQFVENTHRILAFAGHDLNAMPDVQTTVIAGRHDHFLPLEANADIADAFPRGKLAIIEDADHMMHVEHRKTFIGLIHAALQPQPAVRLAA